MSEASPAIDEADLDSIRDSIVSVLAKQCDSRTVHAFLDGKNELAATLRREAAALGWMAIGLPEAVGGFGLGAIGSRLLHVELGRYTAPGAFIANDAAAQVLAGAGDPALGEQRLPGLLAGEHQFAIAASMNTPAELTAAKTLSGQLTLLGAKESAVALVPAGDADLALVDLAVAQIVPVEIWDRTRTLFDVTFTEAKPLALFSDGATARRALTRAFALAVAADSVGTAWGIADKTLAYMKERMQFGRPIGSFQALKHRIVDLVAKIRIAEHVVAQAADMAAAGDASADLWAALAKAIASDTAAFVAADCVQLHGGVGFTWEFDVHIHLKRARLNEMLVADNRTLRDQAAADLANAICAGLDPLELPTL